MTRPVLLPASLSIAAALSLGAPPGAPATRSAATGSPDALQPSTCPPGSLPDGDACVPWAAGDPDGPDSPSAPGAHHDRRGRWITYEQIPRRPDRPADYDAYRYPVPCAQGCVVSGYDLDRDDALQRRGRRLSHVGHGAVDLPQPKGTPVTLVPLDHQVGDAEVLYVGPLFGTTVLTRHVVREGGREREYVLVFGHLEAPAQAVRAGEHLAAGDLVGLVGDTGSPELVHLHLEARRVRDGVDVHGLAPERLVSGDSTVVCDPRNVLPLR